MSAGISEASAVFQTAKRLVITDLHSRSRSQLRAIIVSKSFSPGNGARLRRHWIGWFTCFHRTRFLSAKSWIIRSNYRAIGVYLFQRFGRISVRLPVFLILPHRAAQDPERPLKTAFLLCLVLGFKLSNPLEQLSFRELRQVPYRHPGLTSVPFPWIYNNTFFVQSQ